MMLKTQIIYKQNIYLYILYIKIMSESCPTNYMKLNDKYAYNQKSQILYGPKDISEQNISPDNYTISGNICIGASFMSYKFSDNGDINNIASSKIICPFGKPYRSNIGNNYYCVFDLNNI